MCGFIHSTFTTLPVKVIGLFESNSADTEWCAASGTPNIRTAAATHHNDALRTMDTSCCIRERCTNESDGPLTVAPTAGRLKAAPTYVPINRYRPEPSTL